MTSLALCFAVATSMSQPVDPYLDLASRLPSVTQADKFNELETESLKSGRYMAFLTQATNAFPDFENRFAAANELSLSERRDPTVLNFDRYKATKDLAKEAMRRTTYLANKGNVAAAVQTSLESMRMSRVAFRGGPAIDHLVSVAVYAIAANSLRSVSQVLPIDQALLLQSEADAAMAVQTYETHLRSELAYISKEQHTELELFDEGEDRKDDDVAARLKAMTALERQALLRRAVSRLSDFFDTVAQISRTESKVTVRELGALAKSSRQRKDVEDVYVRRLSSLVEQGFKAEVKKRTLARIVWLYAAVNVYRANHGDLPTSLDQAVPADRLIEPFTGLPFEYGRHENAFWIELPDNAVLGGKTGLKWVRSTNPQTTGADGDVPPR